MIISDLHNFGNHSQHAPERRDNDPISMTTQKDMITLHLSVIHMDGFYHQ